MNKYTIFNDHNNFLHILVCVALLHSIAPARWGQDKAPPPWKIVIFFSILGAFLLLFLLCGSFCYVLLIMGGFMVGFFGVLPPTPTKISAGAHVTRSVLIFLVTLDTNAKNEPTVDCLGGGVHGKVC